MLEWMLFRAIMVAFFILANSFFVAAEFALISVRETRIRAASRPRSSRCRNRPAA